MKSISCIIPAYNEEKNIIRTIDSILNLKKKFPKIIFEIIVINDGSVDDTRNQILKKFSKNNFVLYYENKTNIGLGNSIKKGIKLAKYENFIFIPGDNDLPVNILISMLNSIDQADIIMVYFLNDEIRGRHRFLISNIFNLIYLYSFNLFLKYINAPAIYPTKLLKKLVLKSNRFSIVAEINCKLLRQGCSFKEIPSSRLRGLEESSSMSIKSLLEVIKIYFYLIWEINIKNRKKYHRLPKRIL